MKLSRKYFLTVPLTFIIMIPIFPEQLVNYWYITSMAFFSSWIIFWNVPEIGQCLQSKPLYVEDLIIQGDNIGANYKFMKYYTNSTNFCLALLVTTMADYTFFKNNGNRGLIEITGVIGGVLSLYLKCQQIIAKILLRICYYIKKREEFSKMMSSGIEMKDIINLSEKQTESMTAVL
jgi:hypothetical protein